MSLFNWKKGYTLSEVLITLTLIGFLATMTLSTVGASVQQRTRLAEFRTAYSKMSSALKNISVETGVIHSCYLAPTVSEVDSFGLTIDGNAGAVSTGCVELERAFVRAMGATRFCESDPVGQGCIPANYPKPTSGCFTDYSNSKAYVLDNSMIIITNSKADSLKLFAIDANGRKGPNKWGLDIFPFSVKYSETKTVNGKVFVKAVNIMPAPLSCVYVDTSTPLTDRATRATQELMKESAGVKIN